MPREESADLLEWAARSASSAKEATNKTERTNIYHLDGLAAGLLCTERRNYATGAAEPVDCKSEGGEEKIFRVGTPSMDGVRFYQARIAVLGSVTHLQGIAICEIRRDVARIGDRNIWAFFSEMDVVAVVVEAMRK